MRATTRSASTELVYVLRFLAVGVLNTAVGLGTIYGCKFFLGFGDVPANVIGYAAGLINSFLWNRKWTFSHSGDTAGTILRFVVVFLVAYAANLSAVLLLIHVFSVNAYLAQALATAPYTALFYLGSRYFVFRSRESHQRVPADG